MLPPRESQWHQVAVRLFWTGESKGGRRRSGHGGGEDQGQERSGIDVSHWILYPPLGWKAWHGTFQICANKIAGSDLSRPIEGIPFPWWNTDSCHGSQKTSFRIKLWKSNWVGIFLFISFPLPRGSKLLFLGLSGSPWNVHEDVCQRSGVWIYMHCFPPPPWWTLAVSLDYHGGK